MLMATPGRWFDMPTDANAPVGQAYANPWGDAYGINPFRYGTGVDPQSLLGGDANAVGSPPQIANAPAGQSISPYSNMDGGGGQNSNPMSSPTYSLSAALGGDLSPYGGAVSPTGQASIDAPGSWGGLLGYGGSAPTAGGGLLGGLGSLTGTPREQAQAVDVMQKALGGIGGLVASGAAPLGMIAGEVGRRMANSSYPAQPSISFWEDIMSPDILSGSPEDIQSGLHASLTKAMQGEQLTDDDKENIADAHNLATGGNATADDVGNDGSIAGMAGGITSVGGTPQGFAQAVNNPSGILGAMGPYGVGSGPSGLLGPVNLSGRLATPPANALGGQQVSPEQLEAQAQAETARQVAASRAAARSSYGYGGGRGGVTSGGGWGGGTEGSSSAGESEASGRGASSSGYTCFHEDAMVTMSDGSKKRIAEVVVGDMVNDTTSGSNKVVGIDTPDLGTRTLYRMNGSKDFVTWDHPFLREDGGWVSISPENSHRKDTDFFSGTLENGTVIQTDNGNVTVEGLNSTNYNDDMKLYDLHLDGNHKYYANGFIVHNC